MKFSLWSDFHVEMNLLADGKLPQQYGTLDFHKLKPAPNFYNWGLTKRSDILVLAGDTANSTDNTICVLDQARTVYQHVLVLTGNHDYYQSNKVVSEHDKFLREYCKDNVTFLEPGVEFLHEECLFLGSTGWYDWNWPGAGTRDQQFYAWKTGMNDARCIRFDKGEMPDKLAMIHAVSLSESVRAAQHRDDVKEIVVLTHTIPHPNGVVSDPTHPWFFLNGSYFNSHMKMAWEADTNRKIRVWGFGHTHFHHDWIDPETGIRFVANARGYRGERSNHAKFPGPKLIETEDRARSAFGEVDPE